MCFWNSYIAQLHHRIGGEAHQQSCQCRKCDHMQLGQCRECDQQAYNEIEWMCRRATARRGLPAHTDKLNEHAHEAFIFAVLERLDALHAALDPARDARALVRRNVGAYFWEAQRAADPDGARLYNNVRLALDQVASTGNLVVEGGRSGRRGVSKGRAGRDLLGCIFTRPRGAARAAAEAAPNPALTAQELGGRLEAAPVRSEWSSLRPDLWTEQRDAPRKLAGLIEKIVAAPGECFRGQTMLHAIRESSVRPLRALGTAPAPQRDGADDDRDDGTATVRAQDSAAPDQQAARSDLERRLTDWVRALAEAAASAEASADRQLGDRLMDVFTLCVTALLERGGLPEISDVQEHLDRLGRRTGRAQAHEALQRARWLIGLCVMDAAQMRAELGAALRDDAVGLAVLERMEADFGALDDEQLSGVAGKPRDESRWRKRRVYEEIDRLALLHGVVPGADATELADLRAESRLSDLRFRVLHAEVLCRIMQIVWDFGVIDPSGYFRQDPLARDARLGGGPSVAAEDVSEMTTEDRP